MALAYLGDTCKKWKGRQERIKVTRESSTDPYAKETITI